MKKLFFPAVAALALGLASCSSDNVTPNGGGQPAFAEGGYAKVAIALPTQNGDSRGDNDKFDDGLASEYQVKNATLVLFQGDDEATAVFHSAYKLNVSMDGYQDTPNQITSTTRIVNRINDGSSLKGKHLYALVVLNDNNLLNVGADGKTLTVNGESMSGKGLSYLQTLEVEQSQSNFHNNGILMTNAPLATVKGGGNLPTGNIVTLADFTNAVYETEAEAQSKPATDVYVERAVAKVTFEKSSKKYFGTSSTTTSDIKLADDADAKLGWSVEGWDLDVTNTRSNFVRNTTNAMAANWNSLKSERIDNYRFVGGSNVKANKELYRTYWAEDPNYSAFADQFNTILPEETDLNTKFGDDYPQYCFENTFNVANQNKNQTTRAVVKVKLTKEDASGNIVDAGTFYTFNNDKSRLYTKDACNKRLRAALLALPEVEQWVKANGGYEEGVGDSYINIDVEAATSNYTPSTGAVVLGNSFEVKTKTGSTKTFDLTDFASPATLNEALGITLTKYEGGYAYYPIRIKHFGRELTPWNTETDAPTAKVPSPDKIYPDFDDNNYLGRYGVLRNNWYNITVSTISALGDAVVPSVDGDDTPDDDLYNYIAVRINILSWAKRQQNADL